ncbi:MAG: hypothetical protein GC149_00635 [Gammaproteobacteria bacterium]|nr:hypothetical protein [Gammaproteobacteria bacterium]
MVHCTVLFPGLLGPDAPIAELPRNEWPTNSTLPALSLLLNRSHASAINKQALEHQVLSLLGYRLAADGELPIAAIRQPDAISHHPMVWCLDPVYIQLDREMAYLTDPAELALTEAEARQLIDDLNRDFADVLSIQFHAPQAWLATISMQLTTRAPSEAIARDVNSMQPAGTDAARWRRLLNELQMFLHQHPVNVARSERGEVTVNSLWLWGGGALATQAADIDIVYTDDALFAMAAARNGIAVAPVPRQIDTDLFEKQNLLLVLTGQLHAIRQSDVYAWLAALRMFEQMYLAPLLTALKQGQLQQLRVSSDTLCLTLDRRALRKWWRMQKTIETRMLQLRSQYGY